MKPTTISPLRDGAVTVRQGDNQVTLSAEEVARLVAVATGHTTSVARTPAKARLVRYQITPHQRTSEGTRRAQP
jgi:hypothetical protein